MSTVRVDVVGWRWCSGAVRSRRVAGPEPRASAVLAAGSAASAAARARARASACSASSRRARWATARSRRARAASSRHCRERSTIPPGKVPLSNVDVFIPNAALAQYADGPACDTCSDGAVGLAGRADQDRHRRAASRSGNSSADVPVGSNIPLVIQVGRWRREVTIAPSPPAPTRARRRRHDAPAAQPERGPPAEDRAHHRRRRRARVPAAQDRHLRFRVHARIGQRAGQLLRRHRRHEQVQRDAGRRELHARSRPGGTTPPTCASTT